MWDKIVDWLVTNQAWWVPVIAFWIGKIMERWEDNPLMQTLVGAVNTPMSGKQIVRESKQGNTATLNGVLDVVSPLLKRKVGSPVLEVVKRVSKGRKVGNFLLKLLPVVSRFLPLPK